MDAQASAHVTGASFACRLLCCDDPMFPLIQKSKIQHNKGGRFDTDRLCHSKYLTCYSAKEPAFLSQLVLRLYRFHTSLVFIHCNICTIKHVHKL